MSAPTASSQSASSGISYSQLHGFVVEAFRRAGLSDTDATVEADVLTMTDAWGIFTHGTKNVRGYLRRLKAGGLRATGRPRVAAEGPAWALVDGDSALAMVTSALAMQTAIAKARACGVAYVGVRNSCHFGAAGYYAWLAAREGLIGLSMATTSRRWRRQVPGPVSPAAIRFRKPSPLASIRRCCWMCPLRRLPGGKVYAARTRGEQIPDTWLLGADGRPTTDPHRAPMGSNVSMCGANWNGIATPGR